jgi:hypothetical protein
MWCYYRAFFGVIVALSCMAIVPAQQQDAAPQKPTHKSDQVQNTDPIALSAVHRAATPTTAPTSAASLTPMAADDASKKAALATIEKQIKEKQDHVILLMRLFVDDEKKFVIDPTNPQVDPAVKERRKYEQDELLWESAELAKLKAKRDQLLAAH